MMPLHLFLDSRTGNVQADLMEHYFTYVGRLVILFPVRSILGVSL